jgi:hypothetical protein
MGEKISSKMFCTWLSLVLSLLFFLQASCAVNIQVTKTAKESININDTLEVSISINNLENFEVPVSVKEHIADADPVQPQNFSTEACPYSFCIELPFYSWNVTLQPMSVYKITYKIKPLSFGSFVIPPTEVQTSSGEIFYSNTLNVAVHCKTNGACEPGLGENYFTCPEDCPSGSADGVCDLMKDGRCDPDCANNTDTDCLISTTTTITVSPVTGKFSTYLYVVIIAIIVLVVIFLLYKIRVARE